MSSRVKISLIAVALLAAGPASAADLPAIKTSATNTVPACVTPGRLASYVQSRNANLDPRFQKITVDYMRHGEALGVRWDYAFFQMLVETGNLSFRRGNGRPGDVKPTQNNFAGLGATGNGEPGESFPDVSSGVRAHLEHVLLYAGHRIDNPIADRTRKVQDWGILKSWQSKMTRPVTFQDLTIRWSPGDKGYARDIAAIASRFNDDFCGKPDPNPDLLAEARGGRATTASTRTAAAPPPAVTTPAARAPTPPATPTPPPVKQAAVAPKVEATAAVTPAKRPPATPAVPPAVPPQIKVLNPQQPQDDPVAEKPDTPKAKVVTASAAAATVGGAATGAATALKPSEPGKCRVWTASYGGQKAVVIKAPAGQLTHYTVLEVNEGSERKEAEAYIAVYARGGQAIGEFPSQEKALDKAFDLCPEG